MSTKITKIPLRQWNASELNTYDVKYGAILCIKQILLSLFWQKDFGVHYKETFSK